MKSKAHTEKKVFSRETSITSIIKSDPETIWNILTDLNSYVNWNSTIVSINGEIRTGGKIKLVSTLDPKRTFNLNVLEVVKNKKLVWGDFMGKRTYELKELDGYTEFSMKEKIGGPLFPLFSMMIPDFDESFENFVKDLTAKATSK